MTRMTQLCRFLLAVVAAAALLAGAGLTSRAQEPIDDPYVEIQLLSIAGWRGQLEPVFVPGVGNAGGAAVLASYWRADREANPNTLTLAAGNSFGTSPPISNLFEDEPALEALNLMGLDADTLGNDNFDAGVRHLQRMLNLARFPFLSANLGNAAANLTGVQPWTMFTLDGVRIAVIGVTDPASPTSVFPGNFGTIEVTDAAMAAMQARAEAAKAGAGVFVLLTEMGVDAVEAGIGRGPLVDLASRLQGFDLVLGDDTDLEFEARINGALVIENKSKGVSYSRTALTFDRGAGRVIAAESEFVTPLAAGVLPDRQVEALVASYRARLAGRLSEVVGSTTAPAPWIDACGQAQGRTCESLAGNVVADAMRAAYGTDLALVNSGSIRADISCPPIDDASDFCPAFTGTPLPVTLGQVEAVLPFGNIAATAEVSGAELRTFLENAVSLMPGVAGRFPQVSGFCFAYDIWNAVGSRVVDARRAGADGACGGEVLDLGAASSYTITLTDFIIAGGDGYPNLTARAVRREPLDLLVAKYIRTHSPVVPALQGRVVCLSTGPTPCPSGGATFLVGGRNASITPPRTGDGGLAGE